MNIKKLKDFIKELPDDMEVFVGCQGYTNFNFKENKPWEDAVTTISTHDKKLFITDNCAIEDENGLVI